MELRACVFVCVCVWGGGGGGYAVCDQPEEASASSQACFGRGTAVPTTCLASN
jgi:hypothetical protein